MGIALLALTGLFNNLPNFRRAQTVMVKRPAGRIHPLWAERPANCLAQPANQIGKTHRDKPSLRVLRVQESGQGVASAGRMVISGRMADVCAELDRLAALESRHLRS